MPDLLATMAAHERLKAEVAWRWDATFDVLPDVDSIITAHQPDPEEPEPVCVLCGVPGEYPVPWPCATHQAAVRIRATLTGEEPDRG